MSTSLLRPRIWKISHGDAEFNSEPDLRQWLEEEHLVTMNRGTLKKQGERFENNMSVGDYFYLRESGRIKLFGRIDSDASYVPERVNECFDDVDGWIARKYTVLFRPIIDRKYTGERRKWTPNYNSTLGEVPEDEEGLFEQWILRPFFGKTLADIPGWEYDDIGRETTIMNYALNEILYGPPGTGKTYNVVNYAVAIADNRPLETVQAEDYKNVVLKRYNELKKQGRIVFTTFHQSYGYEDFIEGIRPVMAGASNEEIAYEIRSGVFKMFCDHARAKSLSNFDEAYSMFLEDISEMENPFELTTSKSRNFAVSVNGNGNLRLFTGKDRKKEKGVLTKEQLFNIFSGNRDPQYWKGYYRGVIKHLQDQCGLKENMSTLFDYFSFPEDNIRPLPFVFIIDEINRGNISKIFGELITLIEPNKRLGADEETKATLPYSGEEFGVPKNVYILGTMNTADRSIALLDTALRRRFNFVEMMPEPGRLADIEVEETGIDLAKMLQTMNNRIEFLLDREHTIGHAYFMGDFQKNPTLDGLADIFRNKIVPLLQEYFFDDYSKIRLVLGDNVKPKEEQFVQEETNHDSLFAGSQSDIYLDKPTYRINPGAFDRVEAYTGIYA